MACHADCCDRPFDAEFVRRHADRAATFELSSRDARSPMQAAARRAIADVNRAIVIQYQAIYAKKG